MSRSPVISYFLQLFSVSQVYNCRHLFILDIVINDSVIIVYSDVYINYTNLESMLKQIFIKI